MKTHVFLSAFCVTQHRHQQGSRVLIGTITRTTIWQHRAPLLGAWLMSSLRPLSHISFGSQCYVQYTLSIEKPTISKSVSKLAMHCDKWLCHQCNIGIDASVGFSVRLSPRGWDRKRGFFSATQAQAELYCFGCNGSHRRWVGGRHPSCLKFDSVCLRNITVSFFCNVSFPNTNIKCLS